MHSTVASQNPSRPGSSPGRATSIVLSSNALALEDAGEDPDRCLLIGPHTGGNLLEVVVMITAEGTQLSISRHADAPRVPETPG
jgi:hypothetical protein